MDTLELVLAILGGVVVAALLCWAAVTVALRQARHTRGHGPTPAGRHGRSPRAS